MGLYPQGWVRVIFCSLEGQPCRHGIRREHNGPLETVRYSTDFYRCSYSAVLGLALTAQWMNCLPTPCPVTLKSATEGAFSPGKSTN